MKGMKGVRPQGVIMDEMSWAARREALAQEIRPDYPEPRCCEPCAAVWQALQDAADTIRRGV